MSKKRKKGLRIGAIIILLLFVLSVVAVIAYMIGFNRPLPQYENGASYIEDETERQTENYSKYISIPCFDSLEFVADTYTQRVNFYNPTRNENINFKLELIVYSSSKSLTLYQSRLLQPGKKIDEIKLNETLTEGTYNASLFYECFSSDGTSLNNSKLDFILNVQKKEWETDDETEN